jgi:hypothetical protein
MERGQAKIFMEGNLTFMEGFSGRSIAASFGGSLFRTLPDF